MNARVTEATLTKAARVAAAEGVSIVIEVNGVVYRIAPVGAVSPDQPRVNSCDEAFGGRS